MRDQPHQANDRRHQTISQRLLTRTMSIAYQGEPGAFSEAAARRISPDAQLVACRTFEEVFAAVEAGSADYGVRADRELDRRQHPSQLRPAGRARPADRRRGRAAGRPPSAGAAGRHDGAAAPRLLAPAGAGPVRAVSAHAERRRDHRDLRHRRQRQDGRRRAASRTPRRSPRRGPARCSGWRRWPRRFRTSTTTSRGSWSSAGAPFNDASPDKTSIVFSLPNEPGSLFKALSVVRAARHRSDQARVAADSRAALGVPVLRRHGGGARRAAVRARAGAPRRVRADAADARLVRELEDARGPAARSLRGGLVTYCAAIR